MKKKTFNFRQPAAFAISFFAILLLISSCKKPEERTCFKKAGTVVKEERQTLPYKVISLADDVNLFLSQDSIFKITVEGPKNLVTFVNTKLVADTLFISNGNTCNWLRSYKINLNVYAYFPDLQGIYFRGSGNIMSSDTIRANRFLLDLKHAYGSINLKMNIQSSISCLLHTGSADVTLSGFSPEIFLGWEGSGFLYSDKFHTKYSEVIQDGTGDIYLNSSYLLNVRIYGQGSVFYTGNPTIIKQIIEGHGKLVHLY